MKIWTTYASVLIVALNERAEELVVNEKVIFALLELSKTKLVAESVVWCESLSFEG